MQRAYFDGDVTQCVQGDINKKVENHCLRGKSTLIIVHILIKQNNLANTYLVNETLNYSMQIYSFYDWLVIDNHNNVIFFIPN